MLHLNASEGLLLQCGPLDLRSVFTHTSACPPIAYARVLSVLHCIFCHPPLYLGHQIEPISCINSTQYVGTDF